MGFDGIGKCSSRFVVIAAYAIFFGDDEAKGGFE
jgi:hypothetical protein